MRLSSEQNWQEEMIFQLLLYRFSAVLDAILYISEAVFSAAQPAESTQREVSAQYLR